MRLLRQLKSPRMSWDGFQDKEDQGPVHLHVGKAGCSRLSWDIPGQGRPGTSALTCGKGGMSQVVLGYPRTGKTRHQCTYMGCPRLSWDIPGLGRPGTSVLTCGKGGMSQVVLGYPRTGKTRDQCTYMWERWDVPGCPGISQVVLGYPRTGKTRDQCTYMWERWDVPGCPGISQDWEDQGPVHLHVGKAGCPRLSWDIPGLGGPGTSALICGDGGVHMATLRKSLDSLRHTWYIKDRENSPRQSWTFVVEWGQKGHKGALETVCFN